jgi:hypothetical protein
MTQQSHFCIILGTGLVIDGEKDPHGLSQYQLNSRASFANHSDTANCFLCCIEQVNRVFLVTSVSVKCGEPLTLNYGRHCFAQIHNEGNREADDQSSCHELQEIMRQIQDIPHDERKRKRPDYFSPS